ncbi:hypothetical protein BC937DRAFT_88663 [Endogone sp. FLAS-F59071]|nr:hypothetical protein BC937DRAFT_88663 [Endogone sp. FLAS-F59071]|eukprot:RUS18522.1 hypothetical protein BC937DRAFT_88663 [Endogone sp. FLAS-F59071]
MRFLFKQFFAGFFMPSQSTRLFGWIIAFSVQAACTLAAATSPRQFGRAVLLNKTIWVYGGQASYGSAIMNTSSALDVSIPWFASNPPWIDRTSDGNGIAPNNKNGIMFPTADQTGFYSLDYYGPNGANEFAKYNSVIANWTIIPTTSTTTLPNMSGVIVVTGGVYHIVADTGSEYFWANMTDIPTFDTAVGVWHLNNASGNIPRQRCYHTATIGMDGYSVIVYGGTSPLPINGVINQNRSPTNEQTMSDVVVLDTRTFTWSASNITGPQPSGRFAHIAVQVGSLMVVVGGREFALPVFLRVNLQTHPTGEITRKNTGSIAQNFSDNIVADTEILDTTNWVWIVNFTPTTGPSTSTSISTSIPTSNSTADSLSSNGLNTGAIAGIAVGSGIAVFATIAFFFIRWRFRHRQKQLEPNKGQQSPLKDRQDKLVVPMSERETDVVTELPNEQLSNLPFYNLYKPDETEINKPDEIDIGDAKPNEADIVANKEI